MRFYQCLSQLKMFYFTAFGAQLPIEQMTKKVNGVLPFSRNFIIYMHIYTSLFSLSFPCLRQNVATALAFANKNALQSEEYGVR